MELGIVFSFTLRYEKRYLLRPHLINLPFQGSSGSTFIDF